MRLLPEPAPLRVVIRPQRLGLPKLLDDLLRDLQAARFRRRRSRVD